MTDPSLLFALPPPTPDVEPDMRVGFILSPEFSLLPFASFIDGLRHAADVADFNRQIHCHWKIIGPTFKPVMASCGIEVSPQEVFPDPVEFDYIVVVGGQLPKCLDLAEETFRFIRNACEQGCSIVGLCTGSFILAKAGLLDDRRCAVHFEHSNQFKKLYPRVLPITDQVYVNDNQIITCPGGSAALDLVFSLIETHCGKARAVKVLTTLLVDRHRSTFHMSHRPFGHLAACGNKRVEQAIELMEKDISFPYSIQALAKTINISERELNRAFKQYANEPPSSVWRKMRLSHGHWLLVNTKRTVTQIALECGFSDGAHFCRWFKNTYDESPAQFRKHRRGI